MMLAVCSPDNSVGGIETFYTHLLENLDTERFTIIDANPYGRHRSISRRFSLLPTQLSSLIDVAKQSFDQAARHNPSVIEVCDWPLNYAPAVLDQRIPYVVQCHGSMGQIAQHDPQEGLEFAEALVQLIEPPLLRAAHRIQTSSSANQLFWERATGRRVDMIRPAFKLPPLPALQDLSIARIGRVFGRLQRWKGPHVLCEALQRMGGIAPQVHWYGGVKPWASGDWPSDRRLAVDFPDVWGNTLHHRPPVPREQVFALQATALFNVIPSTWDVFNFAAVESMAAARPTIVSTGAGASELIVDGESGFIFKNGDAVALANVIERVLSLPESRRREIGAAGRETIRVELNPERIMEQRLSAYREAIASFREAPPPRPHEWLVQLLSSSEPEDRDFSSLLNLIPLRVIGNHMARRFVKRVRRRNW